MVAAAQGVSVEITEESTDGELFIGEWQADGWWSGFIINMIPSQSVHDSLRLDSSLQRYSKFGHELFRFITITSSILEKYPLTLVNAHAPACDALTYSALLHS